MKELYGTMLVVVSVFGMGLFLGYDFAKYSIRQEAVRAGAATYITDRETGFAKFTFIDSGDKK